MAAAAGFFSVDLEKITAFAKAQQRTTAAARGRGGREKQSRSCP
jgi:hypothetical protein